jgi:hypothetical protein
MEITEKSLRNILRHAYLCGNNSKSVTFSPSGWESEREETIAELVEDQKRSGKTCYNNFPCDCTEGELGYPPDDK